MKIAMKCACGAEASFENLASTNHTSTYERERDKVIAQSEKWVREHKPHAELYAPKGSAK